jgi:hypothetical protein
MIHHISMFDYHKGIGIKAYTDGYSYDEYGYLHLISILGNDSAVKGLSSAIVTLNDITIESDDHDEIGLCAMPGEKYRILSARLDSGLLHQIVAREDLLKADKKLIYIGNKKDTHNIIFSMIKKTFGTPLLFEWKHWLVRIIHNQGMVDVMQGNVQLAQVNINEKQLDSIISSGIRNKSIRF